MYSTVQYTTNSRRCVRSVQILLFGIKSILLPLHSIHFLPSHCSAERCAFFVAVAVFERRMQKARSQLWTRNKYCFSFEYSLHVYNRVHPHALSICIMHYAMCIWTMHCGHLCSPLSSTSLYCVLVPVPSDLQITRVE